MSSCQLDVDHLVEKVDKCPGSLSIFFAYNWDREKCPLYGVAGCPHFRGCLSIEVNGRTVRTFRIVSIILWMSAVEGCPLSRDPLYNSSGYTFCYQSTKENTKKATDTESPLQEENDLIHILNRIIHLTLHKKSVELL